MIVNKAQLEDVLELSHTTLTEYQDQGLPILHRGARGEGNEYNTGAVVRWLIAREVEKVRKFSPRDENILVDTEIKKLELAERQGVLVPVDQVEPVWTRRVLSAAAYLSSEHSRLAGILEATEGVERKRAVLKATFAEFLTHLGVHGERLQEELDALLSRLAPDEHAAFMARLVGIVR